MIAATQDGASLVLGFEILPLRGKGLSRQTAAKGADFSQGFEASGSNTRHALAILQGDAATQSGHSENGYPRIQS